jgi:hypothetical protein
MTMPAISRLSASPTPSNDPRNPNDAQCVRETCIEEDIRCGLFKGLLRAVHVALMSRPKLQVDHHLPPQRHLNPRMQFCSVSTRDNPLKSVHRHRRETIKFFDFKGLWAKLLN